VVERDFPLASRILRPTQTQSALCGILIYAGHLSACEWIHVSMYVDTYMQCVVQHARMSPHTCIKYIHTHEYTYTHSYQVCNAMLITNSGENRDGKPHSNNFADEILGLQPQNYGCAHLYGSVDYFYVSMYVCMYVLELPYLN
jgi:hypothetical protein